DANKAANIANALADTYIASTEEAKLNSTKILSQWLQDRLQDLKVQAIDADRALQDYKVANNLLNSGKGALNAEQLGNLNTQLANARIAMAEAKARLERIQQAGDAVVTTTETDIAVNQAARASTLSYALNNSDLVRLRVQYRTLAAKTSEIESHVGPQHAV